jgi:hypothetical protein
MAPVVSLRPVHVGFVADEMALEQEFLPVLQLSPVSIIPPTLQTHSSNHHCRYIILAATLNTTLSEE